MKSLTFLYLVITVIIFTLLYFKHEANQNPTPTANVPQFQSTPTYVPELDAYLLPRFENLMTIYDCELPCWWGLRPLETTFDETIVFVEETGFDRRELDTIYAPMPLNEYISGGTFVFYFVENAHPYDFLIEFGFTENDFLKGIHMNFYQPSDWLSSEFDRVSFRSIISQIEEKPEIYIAQIIQEVISATEDTPENYFFRNPRPYEYWVTLFFRDQGVKVHYLFQLVREEENEEAWINDLQLCPTLENTISIDLTLSGEPITEDPPNPESWATPEDSFGLYMDTEEFVQFFIDNPDGCLNVYANRDQQ